MRRRTQDGAFLSLGLLTLLLCLGQPAARAGTNFPYFTNFGNFTPTNLQGWTTDNGVWAVGAPTNANGPSAAFDGDTQCASSGLTADYATGTDSRFITPGITLPAATSGQSLVLGFWQWFQYTGGGCCETASWGDVEVSTSSSNGPWTQVSRDITSNGYGWSYSVVDLSAYAGTKIWIGFHHNAESYTGAGWFLDNVSVSAVSDMAYGQTVDFDTFTATNQQGWSADNGVWQVGAPTNPNGPGAAFQETQCASTGLTSNYPVSTDSRLISPPVTLPAVQSGQSLVLGFWQWFQLTGGGCCETASWGDVEVSKWSGTAWGAWTQVSRQITSNGNDGWSFSSVDLSAYATDRIRIGFHQNGESYTGAGWDIDNVSLSTVQDMTFGQTVTFENFTATNQQGWSADNGVWQVGAPTTTYTDAGLTNGTTYFYKVAGLNSTGTSPQSNESSATPTGIADDASGVSYSLNTVYTGDSSGFSTNQNAVPAAPAGLTATAGDTMVSLSWASSSGSTEYNVYRGTTAGSESSTSVATVSPAGPDGAYQGVQCAATGLAGNYPVSTDSRLISPPVTLPGVTSGESLVLGFWQWFQLAGGGCCETASFGDVEVSVWNAESSPPAWGGWTQLSRQITSNGNTGWSFSTVDLSHYATDRVRIAFHQNGESYTAAGWYIDNVSLSTVPDWTPNQTVTFENFTATNQQGWSADNGVWQVGTPTNPNGPDGAYQGVQAASTGLTIDYPVGTDSRLITPPITLPAVSAGQNLTLEFFPWFQFANGGCCETASYGDVEASTWNGTTWSGWTTISARDFEGTSDWSSVSEDLTAYAGDRIRIGFHQFGESYTDAGWDIDDVTVSLPEPTSITFSPTSGHTGITAAAYPGTAVTLTGTFFAGATSVQFNGTSAAFNVVSDSEITTTVPQGATTGPISVTTPGGIGTSSESFTVLPLVTVATPASATPNPVTAATIALSALGGNAGPGGESALTYTWSATGPAAVTYSDNGDNTAQNATATFSAAGSYTLKVTIADAYGDSATSSVPVTVDQTLTSETLTPGPTLTLTLTPTATQQFTAIAYDQFGNPMSPQPTFVWSVASGGVGSVTSAGLYHGGSVPGSATVKAKTGVLSATVAVTVNPAPVTIVTPASATPNPVTGVTTNLSVLGGYAGTGGAAVLTYTWSYTGPTGVTFSANGTNAAKNTTATFTQAGSYAFTVTITGPYTSTTSSVNVNVNLTATSIVVTPGPTLFMAPPLPQTQQFAATVYDQFGNALSPQPAIAWSLAPPSVGSISSSTGLFHSGTSIGTSTVKAKVGSVSASVTVLVNPPPTLVAPASASPNPASGTSTSLSVVGAYAGPGGAAGLTYTWSVTSGPAGVTFTANGTNAAASTTANFTQVGSYTVAVSLVSPTGTNISTSVTVTVNQTLTSIAVTPGPAVTLGPPLPQTQQFTATALDQFSNALSTQPTFVWSLASGSVGSVSSVTGLYHSGTVAGSATVRVRAGTVVGTSAVTVN